MRPSHSSRGKNPAELTRRGTIRLAGAAGLAAAAGVVLAAAPASPALASQNGWRWCRQCQGLWFAGNPTLGVCPAPGSAGHSFVFSGDYTLPKATDVFTGDQSGWLWCTRCAGLWYALNGTPGVCPAGPGGHEYGGGFSYSLDLGGGGQSNWRWCQQCQGLWFAGNRTGGACPASAAAGHSLAGSGNYHLDVG
jgi:hypothetical protein